jgi:predicted RND superfamily exporter protein
VQLYGQISTVVLITALIGAMVFLPAILSVVDKWRMARRGASKQGR